MAILVGMSEGLSQNNSKIIRDSNLELARIVAMLLVLVVHACFRALGWPSHIELMEVPGFTITKILVESLSIVCVNLFVLISGWYGIHFKIKKLANLFFSVIFFSVLVYGLMISLGVEHLGVKGVASIFMFTEDYWFIKSYIVLMFISPVLNKFIETSTQKQLLTVVVSLLAFQTAYGWTDAAMEFKFGCSALSFMVLYLLARYIRLYADKFRNIGKIAFIVGYIISCLITASMALFSLKYPIFDDALSYVYAYTNPFTIFVSVCLLLFFSKLRFKSKLINTVASSCFSVYLLHTSPFLFERYCQTIRRIFFSGSSIISVIGMIFAFILAVFVVSVLLDLLRKALWSLIENNVTKQSKCVFIHN